MRNLLFAMLVLAFVGALVRWMPGHKMDCVGPVDHLFMQGVCR